MMISSDPCERIFNTLPKETMTHTLETANWSCLFRVRSDKSPNFWGPQVPYHW